MWLFQAFHVDGAWVAGTMKWTSAEMPSWGEVGLFYKQGHQHLVSTRFIREPRVYSSICMLPPLQQMKNLRSPSLTPQAVMGPPEINSGSAICWQSDLGQVMRSLCTS